MSESGQLDSIGEEITACRGTDLCKGVNNKPEKGVYPRGFFPEVNNKELAYFDVVVIGLNPGTASPLEKAFALYTRENEGFMNYQCMKCMLNPIVRTHDYYKRVRKFLQKYIGKEDLNVLWTELVKCESKRVKQNDREKLPLTSTTKEQCFERFLAREIETISRDQKPLLVFLGNEVTDFVRDHRNCFIGFRYLPLYHPTGGFGARFFRYFRNRKIDNELRKSKSAIDLGKERFTITDANRIHNAKDFMKIF